LTDGDGNTVTLEEHLSEEKGKEVIGERVEAERISRYHRPRIKVEGKGSRKVLRTTLFTKEEINKMNWEAELKKAVLDKDLTSAVLAVLHCGNYVSINQWVDLVWNEDPSGKAFSRNQIRFRIRYLVNKSPIKNILVVNKSGKANIYRLVKEARELYLGELYTLYHRNSSTEDMIEIFQKHEGIENLITSDKGSIGSSAKRVFSVEEEKKPEEDSILEFKSTLERTLSDVLGVEVSGKIDININFNINVT
jgi:hypothetical protein